MPETPALSIYETTFTESNKTDAILVVQSKKLHVNKAILSYYSDYFNTLFNSDFKEKSMSEIEIKDVEFEDFAVLLSMTQPNQILPTGIQNAEKLLELADRFLLPIAKHHLEIFLISTNLYQLGKIRIGEKYQLLELLENGIQQCDNAYYFKELPGNSTYKELSDKTKVKLFYKMLTLI
ncbi:hypothetical protein B9Z55_026991 [Caenorhabditis nigoni]|uniref:BTB domain-containing protein n=1 Tax=Caenorhabditis nigoni TaxID=1611254 RepID=A0A2G5SIV8_9PELO|nr:hypothetical protein B9Z55_026991 [Caenorhabditis nigoni]